ncbi:MAG: glycerol-phosphate dehydrogenase [Actinomycetota bacterium]|nr:glycerol-phosphate dehydrogenase [Actinomycetota bacterium]
MDFPEVVVFDATESEQDAAEALVRQLEVLEIEVPFVVTSVHGRKLAAQIEGPPQETPVEGADQAWAAELGARAHRSGADVILAIGGGRCLDVAKLAAARAGLALMAVPTQLSHDGICSPVAVVPNSEGRAESVGAIHPRSVFLSLPTLTGAPIGSAAAGLGDLLANPLALKDWALAAQHGLEDIDQRGWDLSIESFRLIESYLDADPSDSVRDPVFLRTLADSLILSGMAMICAGTSRPASGAEHEISHAADQLFGGVALHGAQVAFGSIFSVALYDEDTGAFRSRLRRLGLPNHPRDLGLVEEDVVALLLAAPDTRPGRFTILEDADLDEAKAKALIGRIWGDD